MHKRLSALLIGGCLALSPAGELSVNSSTSATVSSTRENAHEYVQHGQSDRVDDRCDVTVAAFERGVTHAARTAYLVEEASQAQRAESPLNDVPRKRPSQKASDFG